jgi:hypothetical protein
MGGAATTVAAVDLGLVRQTALTLLTASIAQHQVVRSARSGRFLLGVAGAAVPNALSECRHERSFPFAALRRRAHSRARGASTMPLVKPKWLAFFAGMPAAIRELSCHVLGKTSPVVPS